MAIKLSSKDINLEPLNVVFSPSNSFASISILDEPATTIKSCIFKESLMSPCIELSELIVPFIS